MLLWRHLNTRLERLARMVDEKNREFGFSAGDGMFVTERFTTRKAQLRALFPEFSDRAYRKLLENYRLPDWSEEVQNLLKEEEPT
jgi:hypothetical protein